jgi:hypothetical protein
MAFEIIGKIIDIAPVNQVSDKFKKREFVIERKETGGSAVFVDYIKFQLLQDRCDLINESFLNEEVKVSFNIKGNRWEKEGRVNYFTNLDAWKIEKAPSSAAPPSQVHDKFSAPPPSNQGISEEVSELDDLPF